MVPTLTGLVGGFGVNSDLILKSILEKKYFNPFSARWSPKTYWPEELNPGGCPGTLRKEFFNDYAFDYFTFMDSAWMNIIRKTEVLRSLFRNVVGPLFVISSLIVIFSRHARLFVPIALGAGAISMAVCFMFPGADMQPGNRYEVMVLLLMMMVCAAAVSTVKSWFFSKSSASSQI